MHVVAILKLLGIVVDTVLMAPLVVGIGVLDPNLGYRACQVWARIILAVCGVRVHVRRPAGLDATKPYVFMSNHRSHFDVLALVVAIPEFQLRWVAKKELLDVPVFGWALRHLDHVIIDRSDHEQAMASLRSAEEKMERGVSVIIFPEGTRAAGDDALLPFKRGGFVLASETGVPVVPVAVRGSRPILPRDTWRVMAGTIEVEVGAPIESRDVEVGELMARTRDWLERHACGAALAAPAPARRLAEVRR